MTFLSSNQPKALQIDDRKRKLRAI